MPPLASGTTNVDFNDSMRAALAGAAVTGPLLLHVGSDEFAVDVAGGTVVERRVPLPDRWLKGFGEVQALTGKLPQPERGSVRRHAAWRGLMRRGRV